MSARRVRYGGTPSCATRWAGADRSPRPPRSGRRAGSTPSLGPQRGAWETSVVRGRAGRWRRGGRSASARGEECIRSDRCRAGPGGGRAGARRTASRCRGRVGRGRGAGSPGGGCP
ncbi:hypothetical protein GSI_03894 [Ganoderma sinense ZZ0214-1]|uniref:Uncharacterized protein n=1 Tax=Ganoderma sinense ZZ0214-1 TaxID=1077348 RepID=A0A2G8SKA1_9APHY|nr:hypothetical protein GSI_03894 [Ganoderma sinense ZZ0214-1]